MNLRKCVLNITSEKLIAFIISKWCIEVNPNKVTSITSMPPPHDIKTLRSLQGKIQAIRWFISQLSNKFHLFNALLKKGVKFNWSEGCQKTFDEIKQYLLNPPFFIPPRYGFPFHLYLLVTEFALEVMLAHKNDQAKDQAIYYLSYTLIDYELRYVYIKKVWLALVFTAKKLRYYIFNNITYVISKVNPLKQMMRKAYHNTHAPKWIMFLIEFDLIFII